MLGVGKEARVEADARQDLARIDAESQQDLGIASGPPIRR